MGLRREPRDAVPDLLLRLLGADPGRYPHPLARLEVLVVAEEVGDLLEHHARQVARGQYRAGSVEGKPMRGYREEEKVPPDSNVETFVALRLLVDNWRWGGATCQC